MNCQKAKKIDMVLYLKKLGFEPQKIRGNNQWYKSPFREEKTASFKIDTTKNCWYDYGPGYGGNIIDFLRKFYGCSVSEVLEKLASDTFSFHQQSISMPKNESKIRIREVKKIHHLGLIDYLEKRCIKIKIARQLCKEVHYSLNGKNYFSIAIPNIAGGWDLRNKNFQNATSPKDITYIENGNSRLVITEGMFDMMSLLTTYSTLFFKADLLILNSTSMAKRATKYFEKYNTIGLFLDRDDTGLRTTEYFLGVTKKCVDRSLLYENFKDPNDWLMNKKPNASE